MERDPIVVGRFYQSDSAQLISFLQNNLQVEEHEADCGKVALVVPHAPYRQCGFVMAQGYGYVRHFEVAVILCPNHSGLGQRASVAQYERWRCPIGRLDLDEALSFELVRESRLLKFDNVAHEEEHAIEVQIPILCHINPRIRIVPICLKMLSLPDCEEIARALASAISRERRRVIIIATSDLSHGEPFLVALKNDRLVIERVLHLDHQGLYQAVLEHNISMCGLVPVVICVAASKLLGAARAYLLAYSTTAETNNDRSSVVGFTSMILTKKSLFRANTHLTNKWRTKQTSSNPP